MVSRPRRDGSGGGALLHRPRRRAREEAIVVVISHASDDLCVRACVLSLAAATQVQEQLDHARIVTYRHIASHIVT